MKLSIMVAAVLLFSMPDLLCADKNAAMQLLTTAERQGNLFRDARSPLRLEVSFVAQQAIPTQGHLSLRWAAKDRWWRKVSLSNFQQVDVRNGEKLYTIRNMSFTPFRVGELISLLQFAPNPSPGSFVVKKPKQQIGNGTLRVCRSKLTEIRTSHASFVSTAPLTTSSRLIGKSHQGNCGANNSLTTSSSMLIGIRATST